MIYLVRHAETEWNFQMRKQGLDDSPLTELGCKQAGRYADVMRALLDSGDMDANTIRLFHSPLGRTRVTAQYLVEALGLPAESVLVEPRLIEFDYGQWSGLTNEEIERKYPGALKQREADKWHYTVPGGESYADVETKVRHWLGELDNSCINIAVTHSVVSRVIRGCYLGMDAYEAGLLEHPQNSFYLLNDQEVSTIECMSADLV